MRAATGLCVLGQDSVLLIRHETLPRGRLGGVTRVPWLNMARNVAVSRLIVAGPTPSARRVSMYLFTEPVETSSTRFLSKWSFSRSHAIISRPFVFAATVTVIDQVGVSQIGDGESDLALAFLPWFVCAVFYLLHKLQTFPHALVFTRHTNDADSEFHFLREPT
jgi:hypothetical protein